MRRVFWWLCLLVILPTATQVRAQNETIIKSSGSGFIVDARGYILTNEHVIHRAKSVRVIVQQGAPVSATILSADADHDLALLKIEANEALPTVAIGNSSEAKRQQSVLAMGFPFGEAAITSTSGKIVSIRHEAADQLLVTDAVVNPGNSGGPLLNDRGEAIGVVKALLLAQVGDVRTKAGETYAAPISFAMPLLAVIPGYDWTSVGKATEKMEMDAIDAKIGPAVVQILSDRVDPGTIETDAGDEGKTFKENALALVKSYFDRMNLKYEVDTSKEYPVVSCTLKMDNATHHMRVVIDSKRQLVYLFLNRYLSAPANSANVGKVLQALMEQNWNLNIGKFEWDPSDGEIRYSYCFTTENGIGFEAFEAIVQTLAQTGDRLWPDLKKLTE
jgi:hypothetical protein